MVKVSAPGKLVIAGEWSVLERNNSCIVAAVNKRIFAEAKESNDELIHLTIDDFGIHDLKAEFDGKELVFKDSLDEEKKQHLKFTKSAIETFCKYHKDFKKFGLRVSGKETKIEVDGEIKKIGFGSSAAATVAIISSLMKLHNISLKNELVFKLSAISHYFAQNKIGSGFDVAASTYGGIVLYRRFDGKWLKRQVEEGKSIKEIAEVHWPNMYIKNLEIPDDFDLVVGWTKGSASTSKLIKEMQKWKKEKTLEYSIMMENMSGLADSIEKAWEKGDRERLFWLIRQNGVILRDLTNRSGVGIETPDLRKLRETANKFTAGKLSGAGGQDCGIAITFDKDVSRKIKEAWEKEGIIPLDVSVSKEGVREEN